MFVFDNRVMKKPYYRKLPTTILALNETFLRKYEKGKQVYNTLNIHNQTTQSVNIII